MNLNNMFFVVDCLLSCQTSCFTFCFAKLEVSSSVSLSWPPFPQGYMDGHHSETSSATNPAQGIPTDSRKSRCIKGVVHHNKFVYSTSTHKRSCSTAMKLCVWWVMSAARMALHLRHNNQGKRFVSPERQQELVHNRVQVSRAHTCQLHNTHFLTSPSSRSSCDKQKSRFYLIPRFVHSHTAGPGVWVILPLTWPLKIWPEVEDEGRRGTSGGVDGWTGHADPGKNPPLGA